MKKILKKLVWGWKAFWGTRYFITYVEEGLKDDEILVHGHRIYIPKKKEDK